MAETTKAADPKTTEASKESTTKAKSEATPTEKKDATATTTKAASHTTNNKASSTHTTKTKAKESETTQASSSEAAVSMTPGMTFNGFSPSGTHLPSAAVASGAPSSSFSSASNASSTDSSGISGGAAAGIVIAVLACVAGLAGFVIVRKRRAAARQREQLYKKPDPFTMGFGSHDPPPPHAAYMTNTQPMIQMPPIGASAAATPAPATNTYQNYNAQYQDQHAYGSEQFTQNVYSSQPHQSYTPALAGVTAAAGTAVTTGAAAAAAATTTTTAAAPSSPPQPPQTPPMQSLGVYTVVSTYTPTLSDEIDIQPGDKVEILIEYDDGWCQGINLSRGNIKGVFPRHCVDQVDGSNDNNNGAAATNVRPSLQLNGSEIERLKRVSSMLGAPQQQQQHFA